MKQFFTIEDLLKIEGFATPLGMDVRNDKLYNLYALPNAFSNEFPMSLCAHAFKVHGEIVYGQMINEYVVYNDPCDSIEVPDIKKIIRATKDEDGFTIHLVFDDLTSGSIDYANHYCTYHSLREMSPYTSIVLRIREVWKQAINPTQVIFLPDGERFHVCIEVKHGEHRALIPVTNLSKEQSDAIKKYV